MTVEGRGGRRGPTAARSALFGVFGRRLRPLSIVALLLLLASPASAQSLHTVSEWAVLTGHAMDASSTMHCLGAGRCRELNPWLARYERPVTFTAAKFGLAAAQLWATRKMKAAGHPKWATAMNFAIAGAFVAIAVRNERVGR